MLVLLLLLLTMFSCTYTGPTVLAVATLQLPFLPLFAFDRLAMIRVIYVAFTMLMLHVSRFFKFLLSALQHLM